MQGPVICGKNSPTCLTNDVSLRHSVSKMQHKNNKSKNGKVQKRNKDGLGPFIQAQQRALRVRLPWSWSSNLVEAVAGTGATYSFAVNNCFDPNFTGVGAQPLGFDQYAALFSRYRVLKVRYDVSVGTRTASTCYRMGVFPSASSTLTSDVNAWIIQNSATKFKWVGPTTGSNNVARITGIIDIPNVLGVTKTQFETDMDYSAITSAGPNRTIYLHVFIVGNSGVVAVCDYTVCLWMDVQFQGPVALGLS